MPEDPRSPFARMPHVPEPETLRAVQDLPNKIPGKTMQLLNDTPAAIGEISSQAGDILSDPRHVMPGKSTTGFFPAWMNVLGEVVRGTAKHAFGMPPGDMPIGQDIPPRQARSPFGDIPAHFDTKEPVVPPETNMDDLRAAAEHSHRHSNYSAYLGMRQRAYDRENAGRFDDRQQLPYTESGPDTWLNMPEHPGGWQNAPSHTDDPRGQDPWIRRRLLEQELEKSRTVDDTDGG